MASAMMANAAELTAKETAIVDIGAWTARGEQDKLGANEAMIPELVQATFRLDGGYKQLTEDEVAEIFRQSL